MTRRALLLAVLLASAVSCSRQQGSAAMPTGPTAPSPPSGGPATTAPIFVVLFTHIEDNTPVGVLGTPAARASYLNVRAQLLAMGELAQRSGVKWSLQPDWKILLAAQQYEDAATMASTGGSNVFRHLRDRLGVAIDPHSHESGGYNYTDVAYLLESLGVGGSTVIGGHIWDPSLPQFAEWDRFRAPVTGLRYPTAIWRGDILMGSGTPNHVNDPIVSGVWRPRDRNSYFDDDPSGNIAAIGAYTGDLAGITVLINQSRAGQTDPTCMLTASYHLNLSALMAGGVDGSVLAPLAALRAQGLVELTDFTRLVQTWRGRFGAKGCLLNARTS